MLIEFICSVKRNMISPMGNYHGAEISVILLVERRGIKLLIFKVIREKNNNANTTLLVLFEIRFRSLFFDVEKRRIQRNYSNSLRSFVATCSRESRMEYVDE